MRNSGKTSVIRGAVLTVSMRWTDRLIGFLSTLILARLLAPDDFGIIAMASVVVGLVDAFLGLGVHVALIQNRNALPAHYHAAWTLRFAQLALAAVVIFLLAPQAATYFNDPRIVPVLRFMAVGAVLLAFENIGIVSFQKEMRFGLDFQFTFLKRITGFVITIIAAAILHNYWALVIGTLAHRLVGIYLSYRMHPMRPRFCLDKVKEIFSVSQWMLLNSIAAFLNRNLDSVLVGRQSAAAVVGGYTLANEISSMPTTEVLAPVNRVLFPAFVEAKNDLGELKRLYLLAQGIQSLMGIAAGVGLALVAAEAVTVLLGEKWQFIVPFVQLLAFASVIESLGTSGGYILLTLGKTRSAVFVSVLQVAFLAITAFAIFPSLAPLQLALVRVTAVSVGLIASFWMLRSALNNIALMDILGLFVRPLLGAGLMALAVTTVGNLVQFGPHLQLVAKIFTGLLCYPAAVLALWYLVGRPSGPESYLLEKVTLGLLRLKR